MNFPSRLTSQTVQPMLYTNVVPLLQELHRRTTTGSSLPVTKTFTINMEEEASLVCPGVHRFADTGVGSNGGCNLKDSWDKPKKKNLGNKTKTLSYKNKQGKMFLSATVGCFVTRKQSFKPWPRNAYRKNRIL